MAKGRKNNRKPSKNRTSQSTSTSSSASAAVQSETTSADYVTPRESCTDQNASPLEPKAIFISVDSDSESCSTDDTAQKEVSDLDVAVTEETKSEVVPIGWKEVKVFATQSEIDNTNAKPNELNASEEQQNNPILQPASQSEKTREVDADSSTSEADICISPGGSEYSSPVAVIETRLDQCTPVTVSPLALPNSKDVCEKAERCGSVTDFASTKDEATNEERRDVEAGGASGSREAQDSSTSKTELGGDANLVQKTWASSKTRESPLRRFSESRATSGDVDEQAKVCRATTSCFEKNLSTPRRSLDLPASGIVAERRRSLDPAFRPRNQPLEAIRMEIRKEAAPPSPQSVIGLSVVPISPSVPRLDPRSKPEMASAIAKLEDADRLLPDSDSDDSDTDGDDSYVIDDASSPTKELILRTNDLTPSKENADLEEKEEEGVSGTTTPDTKKELEPAALNKDDATVGSAKTRSETSLLGWLKSKPAAAPKAAAEAEDRPAPAPAAAPNKEVRKNLLSAFIASAQKTFRGRPEQQSTAATEGPAKSADGPAKSVDAPAKSAGSPKKSRSSIAAAIPSAPRLPDGVVSRRVVSTGSVQPSAPPEPSATSQATSASQQQPDDVKSAVVKPAPPVVGYNLKYVTNAVRVSNVNLPFCDHNIVIAAKIFATSTVKVMFAHDDGLMVRRRLPITCIREYQFYPEIASAMGISERDILFCTLNTPEPNVMYMYTGAIIADDTIFVHLQGETITVEVERTVDVPFGLMVADNGRERPHIVFVKENSIFSKCKKVQPGRFIDAINDESLRNKRHYDVAKALREVDYGAKFTMDLVLPLKYKKKTPRPVKPTKPTSSAC